MAQLKGLLCSQSLFKKKKRKKSQENSVYNVHHKSVTRKDIRSDYKVLIVRGMFFIIPDFVLCTTIGYISYKAMALIRYVIDVRK